jgi:uncharacterized protein (UPF0332 family)
MTRENRLVHVLAELARGRASLQAAQELIKLTLFNDAVSRAYYAAYHHVTALVLSEGLEGRSHSGTAALLGQHFIVNNRLDPSVAKALSRLQQFRGEADYNRFFVFTEASAKEELAIAEKLCADLLEWLNAEGWVTR